MSPFYKSLAIQGLARARLFPARLTDTRLVSRLIRSLQPKGSRAELIRLGPAGDGGYLVPDDLVGIEACFSPGVNQVSGFELDCANRGIRVFMADRSVDAPAERHELFHFQKRFIGGFSNAEFLTLDDWVSCAPITRDSDLLLQMDIEGAEYESFLSASQLLMARFRILVVEFHLLEQLWNRPFFGIASRVFEKILLTHSCVHIHPNNCCAPVELNGLVIPPLLEMTFLRNDRAIHENMCLSFPHPLDADNTTNAPVVLPACWYDASALPTH